MRGVRDTDKEENNLQYQTYYRNEYNREKKRKRKHRSNTGYEGKQEVYHRNSRQDNFNNVITFQQTNSYDQNNESEEH